jgi:hypothetical protein
MDIRFKWNVDVVLLSLLQQLRLPTAYVAPIYNAIHPCFEEIGATTERGGPWPVQILERRYATWPSAPGILDAQTGTYLQQLPTHPVESIAYDLAELARRKKGGTDAAGAEGKQPEDGVRPDLG